MKEKGKNVTWNKIREMLLTRYHQLTLEDLTCEAGEEEEMYNKIERKTGKNKEELRKLISEI